MTREPSQEYKDTSQGRGVLSLNPRQALWIIGIGLLLVALAVFIYLGYHNPRFKWTGFQGRSLFAWLQILVSTSIPVAVAIGTFYLNREAKKRDDEQEKREEQVQQEQERREKEAQEEQKRREKAIENERAEEASLQAYLDYISRLLTDPDRPLRRTHMGDNLSVIARAQTLTVLARLQNGEHKRSALQFLYEARLIRCTSPVISLQEADLREANLQGADLQEVYLRRANLQGANLQGADLQRADLREANLLGAELQGTELQGADLQGADLLGVNLQEADLREANLLNANFQEANLQGANLQGANLQEGFEGLKSWIQQASIPTEVPVFKTSEQTGWLKVTENGLEYRLDDRRPGRHSGPRWTLRRDQVKEILSKHDYLVDPRYKPRSGLFSIGPRRNWLYSKRLYPKPALLESEIERLLKKVST